MVIKLVVNGQTRATLWEGKQGDAINFTLPTWLHTGDTVALLIENQPEETTITGTFFLKDNFHG